MLEGALPPRVRDLRGRVFGRLAVLSYAGKHHNGSSLWACLCSCGATCLVTTNHLNMGNTKSCGCLNRDTRVAKCLARKVHGHAPRGNVSAEYQTWCRMLSRTSNPKRHDYKFYGAKGIKVCSRWRESFANFLADMGPRPDGMTLDRVDPTKDYAPDNCRWATWDVQHQNTTTVKRYHVFGEGLTLKEMEQRYGKSAKLLYQRITKMEMSPEEAVSVSFIRKQFGKREKVNDFDYQNQTAALERSTT